jgi:hypothetical protein
MTPPVARVSSRKKAKARMMKMLALEKTMGDLSIGVSSTIPFMKKVGMAPYSDKFLTLGSRALTGMIGSIQQNTRGEESSMAGCCFGLLVAIRSF